MPENNAPRRRVTPKQAWDFLLLAVGIGIVGYFAFPFLAILFGFVWVVANVFWGVVMR